MRIKRGVASHRRHNKVRRATKGMTLPNRSSIKRGKQAATRALQFAYRDRRTQKRTFRQLWNARINAGARLHGTTYSQLIAALSRANIKLDRKVLSELAVNEPVAFAKLVNVVTVKK